MNTIKKATAISNYNVNNDFSTPVTQNELDEFKMITGLCDAATVTDLSHNFAEIIKLLAEQNKKLIKTNNDIVKEVQLFFRDQSKTISTEIGNITNSIELLKKANTDASADSSARIDKVTREMMSGYSGIIRAINFNGTEQRKAMRLSDHASIDNSKFNNTATKEEQTRFLNDLNRAARMIANKRGVTPQEVLNSIYKRIKDSGDDIYEAHKQYKIIKDNKYVKLIKMCCEADHYRSILEQQIVRDLRKEFPERYSLNGMMSQKIDSVVLMGHPKKVMDYVEIYRKRNNTKTNGAALKLYKEVGERLNRNLKEAAKEYAKTLGYKNCSTCYYIANHEDCMNAMKDIIKESL